MEHAERGAAALDSSNALAATAHFTKALIEHPNSPDYFTQRSTAFTRLKPARHDLALRDAEYAVLLGRKRQQREKIQAGQQRRVVALYGLGKYAESKSILESMTRWIPKGSKPAKMEHDMWMARITSKLKGKTSENQGVDTGNEYPEIDLPNEKTIQAWLRNSIKNDGTFRFDMEEDTTAGSAGEQTTDSKSKDIAVEKKEMAANNTATLESASAQTQQKPPKSQPVRYDWYQDTSSVTMTFYAKKVDKTKLESTFTDDHMHIAFPHPEAPDELFSLDLDPTFASIDSSTSTAKATGAKVEVKLVKKEKGIKWAALDNKDRPKADKLPSAWTTKGDQDWDKKAAELTKKEPKKKKDKKGDDDDGSASDADSEFGGDAVDGFFKKLYSGADDDTRRAMMKSFQESNGTSLSTNWSEVSKGKVEEVRGKDS